MNKRGLLFLYLGFFLISFSYRYIFLFVAAAAVVNLFSFSFLLVLFFLSGKGIHHIYVYGIYSVDCSIAFFPPLFIWKWVHEKIPVGSFT